MEYVQDPSWVECRGDQHQPMLEPRQRRRGGRWRNPRSKEPIPDKRRRAKKACIECQRLKRKCERIHENIGACVPCQNNKRQCSFESHDLLDHLASTYIPVSNTWAASRPNMAYHPSEAHDSKQPNYALQAQYQVVSQNLGPMSFLQYPVPGNVPVEILTEPPNEIRPLYFIADGPSILSFQPVTHSYGEKVIRWSNGEAPSKEFYGDSAAGKTQHLCDARQVGQTERIRVTAQKESVVMPYPALEEDPTVESSWSRSPGLKYDGWDQGGCIPSGEPEPRNLHSAWHRTQDTPMYNIDPLLTECDPFMGRPQVDQSGSFLGMTTLG